MSLTLWIPSSLQYGELAAVQGRPGALRESVQQAIKCHLFGQGTSRVKRSLDKDKEKEAPQAPMGAFDEVLKKFKNALSQPLTDRTDDAVLALWRALIPVADLDTGSPPTAEPGGDSQGTQEPPQADIPQAYLVAFCWATHGLCAQLALGWLERVRESAVDASTEEEVEEEEECADKERPDRLNIPRVEYHQVVSAIASLVRQSEAFQAAKQEMDNSDRNQTLHLVAAILLDALLQACHPAFVVITGTTVSRDGRPHTPKWLQPHSPALVRGIRNLLMDLPARFTVQPLKEPVAYQPDHADPTLADRQEHFQVELIGYRRRNRFLRHLQAGQVKKDNRLDAFGEYVEAINLQQAVPWRVNRPLLAVARDLCALVISHDEQGADPEATLTGLESAGRNVLVEWVQAKFHRPAPSGGRRSIARPAEFLDNPLAQRALQELCPAKGGSLPFYLVWKADYRGRLYAQTPWLTPQGGDLQRALLEFDQGRPLDAAGVQALRRHGANLVRRERLLADLGIEDRQVVTLAERERWVVDHEQDILASAASPLEEPFWREVASKPMQFLAFCLAYRQWSLEPEAPIHLPVQIDGTCNGMQHIAALTGDQDLARAVNVLPGADGVPGDIYSELAREAAACLGSLEAMQDRVHGPGLALANRWLASSSRRRGWVNRDTAKKVVMTIPYGAGAEAQAHYVLERISAEFESEWGEVSTDWLTEVDRCITWTGRDCDSTVDKSRRRFVARCCRGLFSKQRRQAFGGQDEVVRALAHQNWERMRTLGAYAALAIVRHLRSALTAKYPTVDAFSAWLQKVAKACGGMPLMWLSPRGFPVCQDKFRLEGTSLSTRLGARTIRIDVKRLSETVAVLQQGNALLPNLIHSLDATHLVMTLLSAARRGVTEVGTIHDCLLCHPMDANALGEAVRQTFIDLYDLNEAGGQHGVAKPMIRWQAWMELIAAVRNLDEPTLVLGAFHEPGGLGEQFLRQFQPTGNDAEQRHAHQLALLADLRQLDAPHQFLARLLLEYRRDEYRPATRARQGRVDALPVYPFQQQLPRLDHPSSLSDYFFS